MNAIDVTGPMAVAFQSESVAYQPVFSGTELEIEQGQTVPTLKNLNAILDAGNQEIAVFLLGNGRVVVVFTNANTYLATGFSYGHHGQEVRQFAAFASKHGFGDFETLFGYLSGLPKESSDVMTKPGCDGELNDSMDDFNDSDIILGPRIL